MKRGRGEEEETCPQVFFFGLSAPDVCVRAFSHLFRLGYLTYIFGLESRIAAL